MWDEKEASHAFIVGYLEGSMKAVASFLASWIALESSFVADSYFFSLIYNPPLLIYALAKLESIWLHFL
jgi:Zn-dependent protease with chaperone function